MGKLEIKEKRAFARFPVKITAKYFNLEVPCGLRSHTYNISTKGICLITNQALAEETPLDIWLQMPDDGEPIVVKGKVIWSNMLESNKYRVGISLENTELNPILLVMKAIRVRIRHH